MVTAVCGGIVTSLLRGGGPKRWASPVAWLGDLEAANDVVPDLAVWVEVAVDDTESRYSRASESDGENALLGDVWRAGVFAAPRLARVGEVGALAARCGPCDREEGAGVFDRPDERDMAGRHARRAPEDQHRCGLGSGATLMDGGGAVPPSPGIACELEVSGGPEILHATQVLCRGRVSRAENNEGKGECE